MKDKSAEYAANGGWSSHHFAPAAIPLMLELQGLGVRVTVGRSVIHLGKPVTLKAYVHHNGRTEEYATLTNSKGEELATFHYTEADKLRDFILAWMQ